MRKNLIRALVGVAAVVALAAGLVALRAGSLPAAHPAVAACFASCHSVKWGLL